METLSRNKNKWIRSLGKKKYREIEQHFVVEGNKIVEELIAFYPDRVAMLVTSDESYVNKLSCPFYHCSAKEMKELSTLSTPSSVLAVVAYTSNSPEKQDHGLTLVLDDIQDPGNLGTIIRTADWFGVQQIVCSKNTVDIYNPKVLQATMGSIFRMTIDYVDLSSFLSSYDKPIFGALLEGENMYETKMPADCALIIGNEGKGISNEIQAFVTSPITIPKFGEAESLNAAMATGILLAHFHS